MSNDEGKAPNYGEPWWHLGGTKRTIIEDSKPDDINVVAVFEDDDRASRAAECVNAFEGCPDPKASIDALKKMATLAATGSNCMAGGQFALDPELSWLGKKSK